MDETCILFGGPLDGHTKKIKACATFVVPYQKSAGHAIRLLKYEPVPIMKNGKWVGRRWTYTGDLP